MKIKHFKIVSIAVILALCLAVGTALADDSVIFRRNISKTPAGETEYASISFMPFTVPAQAADGTLLSGVEYIAGDIGQDAADGTLAYTTPTAKPLIASYIDDSHAEDNLLSGLTRNGGLSIGEHDAFVAHSLDDGASWKTTNLSDSADLSSFTLKNGYAYPGDVYSVVQATVGNRVMAAWLSRYCDGGSPLYTRMEEPGDVDDESTYAGYLKSTYGLPDMYLMDIWGVAGTQKSVDYTLQGFPEVGELPYGCVWTARGTLVEKQNDAGQTIYDMVWTKPERLTSGVRDAMRLEIDGVKGAGFAITWQEDPEGLRPGQGLGPGEGWSGAIVNAKTDIWYSYISWENFNLVDVDGDAQTYTEEDTLPIEEYFVDNTTQPKPAVPMAIPVRLTDNNMCKSTDNLKTFGDDYCHADFDFTSGEVTLGENTDFCSTSISWTSPGGSTLELCQAPDGRVFNGRVGSSRARMTLQPYTKADGKSGAWFIMAYEETKALGDILIDPEDPNSDPIEIGKNIWYHTFDLAHPEVVQQGGMLNQPVAYNPEMDEQAPAGELLSLEDEFGNTVYQTEIARRFSMVAQPVAKIGATRTAAYLLYKQGILNQGGPADIFARRIVVPPVDEGFDPAVDNPYLYKYMACDNWVIPPDGTSTEPNYLMGLCGAPATNLSATTNDLCYTTASATEPSKDCVDDFPWDGQVEDQFPKVAKWDQSPDNLDDQSWENPFDVAKGHRGFLDGDFLMVLYAWSPNWKSNSVGNDKYNLYVRRSFDGGQTWTTTPSALGGAGISDATADPSLCENWGIGGQEIETVCYSYDAGEFERARNVSQLTGTRVTVLDPRYTPTGGVKKLVIAPYVDAYLDTSAYTIEDYDQTRDSSKFFVVYETGDNTTAAVGEPTPLDLFYSRATVYGDFYEWETTTTSSGQTIIRWPWLEKQQDDLSGEAALTANPSGDIFYADWSQWREDELGHVYDSDVWYRRMFYNIWELSDPTTNIVTTAPVFYDFTMVIELFGAAKDTDRLGEDTEIVEYEWTIDSVVVGDTKDLKVPANNLKEGWHTVGFRAKDNDGNWSNPVFLKVFVAKDLTTAKPYTAFLPSIRR